jgi:phosphoenolpyruvate carboxykinase (ATP)
VAGRREFTEEVSSEGLRQEIIYAAERSFRIDRSAKEEKEPAAEIPAEEEKPIAFGESKSRPRRERFWRSR